MALHDDSSTRARTERLAYHLWQEAGCPEGQADRFWREAQALIATQEAVPPEVSAPASDPAPVPRGAGLPLPQAPLIETGWRAAAARYLAAWWAYPSKPTAR